MSSLHIEDLQTGTGQTLQKQGINRKQRQRKHSDTKGRWMLEVMESARYLGLSGEGFGLRGGGVRGTAGLGAMEAAGIKP